MASFLGGADKPVFKNQGKIDSNFQSIMGSNFGILNSIIGQKFGQGAPQLNMGNAPGGMLNRAMDLAIGFETPIGIKKGRQGLGGSIMGLAGGIIGGILGGPTGAVVGSGAGQALGSATQRNQTRIRL